MYYGLVVDGMSNFATRPTEVERRSELKACVPAQTDN